MKTFVCVLSTMLLFDGFDGAAAHRRDAAGHGRRSQRRGHRGRAGDPPPRRDLPAASEADGSTLDTSARGDAVFTTLEPGTFTIHVESPGFEPADVAGVRVRAGDNRREVKLKIAKLAETVQVGRDPRERASDPRGNAFATVLDQAQIDELPDDPDEMEQMLRDMAGPGSVLRVNGFRGGRLPPKGQIQQIRFRRNMFAADTHEPGFVVDRHHDQAGHRQLARVDRPRLSQRRAQRAQRVRAGQGRRAVRTLFVQRERTALEAAHIALAVGGRHGRVRLQDDRGGAPVRLLLRFGAQAERLDQLHRTLRAHAHEVADVSRRVSAQPLEGGEPRRRRLRPHRSRLQTDADRERAARIERGRDRQDDVQRAAGAVAERGIHVHADQRRAGGPRAERVQCRRSAARRLQRIRRRRRSPTTSISPQGATRFARVCSSTPAAIAPANCETPAARSRSPASTPTTPACRRRTREMPAIHAWRFHRRSWASTCRTTSARGRI